MNKPKIDLKARLGRRPGAAPASASIPPPVGVQPPHAGSVAPMGQTPSYAPQPSQPRASYDPMGVSAMQAPTPVRVAPPVAFEVDEEFAAANARGGRRKAMLLAAAAAVVGGVLGFAVGGLNEKNKVAEAAVAGARTLTSEIDAANATVAQLRDTLEGAAKALQDGKYPDEQVKALGGINIPFDGNNLAGKSIGRFKPQLINMLISYAEAASKANAQKDKIRGLLSFSKAGVEELLAQRTNPHVRWAVALQSGPQGPWGNLQLLPQAFPVAAEKGKGGWPTQFELLDGKKKVTVKRYLGGDPGKGNGIQVIPIAPASQNAVCPTDTIVRLRRELADMQKVLIGDDTPGQEVEGIIQLGDNIKKQLAGIGAEPS